MKPSHHPNSSKIDAYLDKALAAEERDQFSREIAISGQLQGEIALQVRVDESLARLFVAPPSPCDLLLRLRQPATSKPVVTHLRRRWMKVAALATAATIVWGMLTWYFFANGTVSPRYNPNLPLETIYQNCVADGFRPKWVCEDKHEFAATFFARQGQGLLLADMPVGTKMEGLTYRGGLSRYTTTMLARVNGLPVMIFVDRAKADTHPALPSGESKLHLFRKELGPLVVYELTPLDQPRVCDYLYLADVPPK
jgi:hypothetical protein